MTGESYTTSIRVDARPAAVFAAINDPRAWWSRAIEGVTGELGAVFYHH